MKIFQTTFIIHKMDCPCEENLIRLKLSELPHIDLDFNLPHRKLMVFYEDEAQIYAIEKALSSLKLGSRKTITQKVKNPTFHHNNEQKKLLWIVLMINFLFFLIEAVGGWMAQSMGVIADSLDMLADSLVYAIALLVVGKSIISKKHAAKMAGYLQMTLAIIGFMEVLRRFIYTEQAPNYINMIIIAVLALFANIICLYLLQKSKSKEEAHMKASMIFTANDIIINLGVISAGILVSWFNSNKPDLIIGTLVFLFVYQGALRILKLSR